MTEFFGDTQRPASPHCNYHTLQPIIERPSVDARYAKTEIITQAGLGMADFAKAAMIEGDTSEFTRWAAQLQRYTETARSRSDVDDSILRDARTAFLYHWAHPSEKSQIDGFNLTAVETLEKHLSDDPVGEVLDIVIQECAKAKKPASHWIERFGRREGQSEEDANATFAAWRVRHYLLLKDIAAREAVPFDPLTDSAPDMQQSVDDFIDGKLDKQAAIGLGSYLWEVTPPSKRADFAASIGRYLEGRVPYGTFIDGLSPMTMSLLTAKELPKSAKTSMVVNALGGFNSLVAPENRIPYERNNIQNRSDVENIIAIANARLIVEDQQADKARDNLLAQAAYTYIRGDQPEMSQKLIEEIADTALWEDLVQAYADHTDADMKGLAPESLMVLFEPRRQPAFDIIRTIKEGALDTARTTLLKDIRSEGAIQSNQINHRSSMLWYRSLRRIAAKDPLKAAETMQKALDAAEEGFNDGPITHMLHKLCVEYEVPGADERLRAFLGRYDRNDGAKTLARAAEYRLLTARAIKSMVEA